MAVLRWFTTVAVVSDVLGVVDELGLKAIAKTLLATVQIVGNLSSVLSITMPEEFSDFLTRFKHFYGFDIISLFQLDCLSDGRYAMSLTSNIVLVLVIILIVYILYRQQKTQVEREDYSKTSKKATDHLKELFGRFDADGEGITADEVVHILKKCDPATAATKKMMKLFKAADTSKSGSISAKALIKIMAKCGMDPSTNADANEVIEAADADKDGKIDILEFQAAISNVVGLKLAEDAKKIVDKADQDGSGRIDFEEFHDAVVNQSSSDDGDELDLGMLVRNKALADVRDAATGRLFLLVFLLYPALTNKIFEGLSCRTLGGDYSILYADYSVDCGSLAYVTLNGACVALVLLWPVGLPVGLLYIMWKEKDDILNEDEDTLQKFDFALGDYNTRHWYWEVIELSRKLILTGFISVFQRGSIAQTVVATLLSFFFFAFTLREQPFAARHLNIIKVATEIQLFVILLCCVVLQTHEQGFKTEVVTQDDYGLIQVVATLAVMPLTGYLVLKGFRDLLMTPADDEDNESAKKHDKKGQSQSKSKNKSSKKGTGKDKGKSKSKSKSESKKAGKKSSQVDDLDTHENPVFELDSPRA